MRYSIDNKLALNTAFEAISAEFAKTGYVEITTRGERRSLDANAIFWVWCRQVAKHRDDGTDERDVAAEVKLLKGFTIRRADDADFDELMTKTVDKLWPELGRWDFARSLAKEIECTSRMSKGQMSKLLEWMQLHFFATEQIRLEGK